MPAVFSKLGLHFVYPESWTLEEAEAAEGNESVTVYGPGGAFWSVTLHPDDADPQRLVDEAVEALRAEYEQLDVEPAPTSIAGHRLAGAELNFYCLDLTNTAWFRAGRHADATILIYCQAEDRDLADVAPVFEAITTSLLRG